MSYHGLNLESPDSTDIKYISSQNSTQRLISFFLQKNMESSNSFYFQFPASKQTVASMLNVTPETFSRAMLRLTNSGLIEINGKDVIIKNAAGLRNFS
jgi:CRP-like cAMP-binding protein